MITILTSDPTLAPPPVPVIPDPLAPFPLIYTEPASPDQLCSPVHPQPGPPTYTQIIQSRLLHRRVKLNIGGVR